MQSQENKSTYTIFVGTELRFGKLVHNYSNFPKSDFTNSTTVNIDIECKSILSASEFIIHRKQALVYIIPIIGVSLLSLLSASRMNFEQVYFSEVGLGFIHTIL